MVIGAKKGILFTVDSIFSFIMVFGFIVFILYNLSYQMSVTHADYQNNLVTDDISMVLVESNLMQDYLQTGVKTNINNYLSKTLPNHCANISVYNPTSLTVPQSNIVKSSCFSSLNPTSSSKVIMYNEEPYTIEVKIW